MRAYVRDAASESAEKRMARSSTVPPPPPPPPGAANGCARKRTKSVQRRGRDE